jgi:hypothetical protein
VTPGLHIWPAPLQAFALVTSLRLRLRQNQFAKTNIKLFCNIEVLLGLACIIPMLGCV